MTDPLTILESKFAAALAAAFGAEHAGTDPLISPAKNPKFGDYQANVAMSLAKKLGQKPRDVAQAIIDNLDASEVCSNIEIAGPGFINLHLTRSFVDETITALAGDAQLGVQKAADPQTIVVDYSSPNVAKEMHVGHLRSTIIGDAIVRVLEMQGHKVIRQNHLGDWGTQFGMLIENLIDQGFDPASGKSAGELTAIYKQSKKRFDDEADFAERAKQRVVKLQSGDEQTNAVWRALVEQSKQYFQTVYDKLGVRLTGDDACGESFYNDRLPGVVERLQSEGHLHESAGARVVYPEGFTDREGEALGMIVQKSDGGFLYATTDLAAALYRAEELQANRVIYVIGLPQKQHFEMFTAALRQFKWIEETVQMDFAGFGSILGPDGKVFKTRSGDTVRLMDLITEAEQRARAVIEQKNPELENIDDVAGAIGIGAIKYADLSSDRVKDYTFDWDRMLSFDGNTAPYLQNAYVRIRSIFRKGEVDPASLARAAIATNEPSERQLALKLFQFKSVVDAVAASLEPHRLCTYLFELATAYHHFYEHCPVLKAEGDTRASRLRLSDVTARTLSAGLNLLGIRAVERM